MARRRKQRENLSGYFRQVFQQHPHWLHESSNDVVLARYREDHGLAPDKAIDTSVRNNLANIKSKLRREEREGGGGNRARGPRRPPKPAAAVADHSRLTELEEQIDECLSLAKNLDREGLGPVITLLRRARNEVVLKSGQP
jgi:hypothetical protein